MVTGTRDTISKNFNEKYNQNTSDHDLYSRKGTTGTNDMAGMGESQFRTGTAMTGYFNRSFVNSRRNHFTDHVPQTITLVPAGYNARNGNRDWERSVSDNARFSKSTHILETPGYHTLKIWMVDPGVVIQKVIVNTGGLRESYLGPPESFRSIASGQSTPSAGK